MNKKIEKILLGATFALLLYVFSSRCSSMPKNPAVIIGVNKDRLNITSGTMEEYAVATNRHRQVSFPWPKNLEEPQWSPNRCWIIFSTGFSEAYGGGNSEIYVMPSSGQYTIQITRNVNESDYAPSWSPDSKHIVYYSSEVATNNEWGIYTLDLTCIVDGKECKPRPQFIVKGDLAKWSPTSNEILVQGKKQDGNLALFIYDLESGQHSDLGVGGWNVAWSPDGKQIAYRDWRQKTIIIMDKNGLNAYTPIPDDLTADNPSWSPDGKYLLFTSYRGDYGKPFKFAWGAEAAFTSGLFSLELSTGTIAQLSMYIDEEVLWYSWYPGPPDKPCN